MSNEALRLAETLLDYELSQDYVIATIEAAAELRRLHEVNTELIEALKLMFLVFNKGNINESEAHALVTAFEFIVKAGVSNA